jgi:TolA-binding protein
MHEVEDELREIKREIIESRGLVIKTNNLTNALSADIKSIAKRQQGYERRFAWNSAVAYVAFVVVLLVVVKFVVDARIDAIGAEARHLRDDNARMKQELDDLRQGEDERRAAELEAAKFTDLVKQGKRVELIHGWEAMKTKALTKTEAVFLTEAVQKARSEQASMLYLQGLESARLQRWQEAAGAFEESLRFEENGAVSQQSRLQLAAAYRKLHRQKDAIALLEPLSESGDKEAQADALEQLAWSQTEIEAYNDSKNTWRTLLRRFPDSHYVPEAKLALYNLVQYH